MSRISIPYGGVLKCDMKCGERFTTYSLVTYARGQAKLLGWGRMFGRHVRTTEGYTLGMGGQKVDLCPACLPLAKAAHKERKAALKAERAAKKAASAAKPKRQRRTKAQPEVTAHE